MSSNERLGLASRLHLLLRRNTGRVTDIEWLAVNADYAKEIIRFARLRTVGDETSELTQLVDRFEQLILSTPKSNLIGSTPAAISVNKLGTNEPYLKTQLGPILNEETDANDRYVYGLR
ncbi:hypothetical protein TI03_01720 [Achromatium sp. WMS1]|nr:hypothetical protein TI03_01720 [Achromatium sp. WMS1]